MACSNGRILPRAGTSARLLMLDEPFGALDAFTREEFWAVMQNLWLQKRFTAVLVTHDLREAVYLSDKVFVIATSGPVIYRRKWIFRVRARWRPLLRQAYRYRARFTFADQSRARHMTNARRTIDHALGRYLRAFLVWEAGCWLFGVAPYVLPRPTLFFKTMYAFVDKSSSTVSTHFSRPLLASSSLLSAGC